MVIDPVKLIGNEDEGGGIKLARVLNDPGVVAGGTTKVLPTNAFEDILSKAVDALEGVSQTEFTANDLMNKYIQGSAELSDVMIATSKMSIAVQLAVTVINSAVSSFQQLTQMQI